MDMRYRLPELMKARGWTAYRVAKETGWRISTSTAHRILAKKGKVGAFDPKVVEALMDAFKLGDDLNLLLARDYQTAAPSETPAVPKRKPPAKKAARR